MIDIKELPPFLMPDRIRLLTLDLTDDAIQAIHSKMEDCEHSKNDTFSPYPSYRELKKELEEIKKFMSTKKLDNN